MKTKYIMFTLLLVVLHSTVVAKQTTTLILKDYSGSVQMTDENQVKEDRLLRQVLVDRIQKTGDKVVLSYIFLNSASVANEQVLRFTIPEQKGAPILQRSTALKYKLSFINQVIANLKSNAPKSNETHLLECLPRIIQWAKKSANFQVVILSDMVEFSPRRKFDKLTSHSDARAKGKTDAQKLAKDFQLEITPNAKLTITCVLPVEMMHNAGVLQFLSAYWEGVFNHLLPSSNLKFQTL